MWRVEGRGNNFEGKDLSEWEWRREERGGKEGYFN